MPNEDLADEFVALTRRFVDDRVIPQAPELERDNSFPDTLVKEMAEMGMFGMVIDEEYGGLDVDWRTYWRVVSELSRGWMSLGGVLNSHIITAHLLKVFGTEEQKTRYLPKMATGELRAALAMTEAEAGSDVAAIRTTAVRNGDTFVVNGSKMFITNGERAGLVTLLAITDKDVRPRHRGLSVLLAESGPGLTAGRKIEKLGYNGVETVPLSIEDLRVPADNVLGGEPGRGFYHVMTGGEIGRLNVGARAHGVARAAVDEATRYAMQRHTFGQPISNHQAIQMIIADMVTKTHAAAGLLDVAADAIATGRRADMEAGMAKLYATEAAVEVVMSAMRIHGGYGYTKEFLVERLYRDAPQMVIAEGTNEIQRMVIARSHFGRAAKATRA
ncbi:MAG: acyl-CoA dehydrogenase [Actinobacteria bacterium]|nr:acyl-CoA dehydrogenase [Actinomycetota bacterium]MQB00162.1 acyl-CoA dehydrogenase [Actinomycetota bacterium]